MKYYVPYPDEKVFKYRTPPSNDVAEFGTVATYEFDHAEYEGGIKIFKKGVLYPTKGFVFPEAIHCINISKKIIIEGLRLLADWRNACWIFAPKRLAEKVINLIVSPSLFSLKGITIKDEYLIPIAYELKCFITHFLKELGLDTRIAEVIGTIINYDCAYHWRLLDLFSETTKEKMLLNPRKEVAKMVKVYCKREKVQSLKDKFIIIKALLSLMFFHKKFKKAFKKAICLSNFKNFQYDEIDWYNVLERMEYDYGGKTWAERRHIFLTLHNGILPKPIEHYSKQAKHI